MKSDYLRMYFALCLFILLSCKNERQVKLIEIRNVSGEVLRGYADDDSTFNGIVKYYDSSGEKYLGYTTFKHGYESGPTIRINNDNSIDSLFYDEPISRGFEYLYDSRRNLEYKAYLYDGRVVGPVYDYDSSQKLRNFYFYSFEGEVIYQAKSSGAGFSENGSIINLKINEKLVNGKKAQSLFLYLINLPYVRCYYSLAVLDKNRNVISSEKIESNNFFFETYLDPLPEGKHYAVVCDFLSYGDERIRTIMQEVFL